MHVFEDLERHADDLWHAEGYEPHVFADIAARVLDEGDLRQRLDPLELLRFASSGTLLEQHGENAYGEPAVTVRRNARFRVELIFWIDGAARAHQHVEHGAFHVLEGERLHCMFCLNDAEPSEAGVLLGDLVLDRAERLVPGDTRRIYPGSRSIHALFFLGRPCVTVSLRAIATTHSSPYYVHANRYLAFDLRIPRVTIQRKLRALQVLRQVRPEDEVASACTLLRSADMLSTHLVLTDLADRIPRPAFETLVAVARDRHGPALDRVLLAEAEERRRKLIESLLPQFESCEHRLLLGLIWTGAAREVILDLLAPEFPGPDRAERVADWLDEMAALHAARKGSSFGREDPTMSIILGAQKMLVG
jgi:hypothetical protein